MIDRDGRVVFGSLLVFVVAVAGSIVVEQQTGVALRDRPLLAFLVFAGIGVARSHNCILRSRKPAPIRGADFALPPSRRPSSRSRSPTTRRERAIC